MLPLPGQLGQVFFYNALNVLYSVLDESLCTPQRCPIMSAGPQVRAPGAGACFAGSAWERLCFLSVAPLPGRCGGRGAKDKGQSGATWHVGEWVQRARRAMQCVCTEPCTAQPVRVCLLCMKEQNSQGINFASFKSKMHQCTAVRVPVGGRRQGADAGEAVGARLHQRAVRLGGGAGGSGWVGMWMRDCGVV